MATQLQTFITSMSNTNREELDKGISNIAPSDTPILTMIGQGKTNSIHPEWAVDTLNPPADNAHIEAEVFTYNTPLVVQRYGNYTQIFIKTFSISNTQIAVNTADDEYSPKYQMMKVLKEIKTDIEYSIVASTPSANGSATVRRSGGLPTWLTSNVDRGTGGQSGGFSGGVTTAPKAGTPRTISLSQLENVMQLGYQNGANFSDIVMSPGVFTSFSHLKSDSNIIPLRSEVTPGKGNTISSSVKFFEGQYGPIRAQANRVMRNPSLGTNAFFIDKEMLQWLNLRPIAPNPKVTSNADGEVAAVVCEGALKVKNEKGIGMIADLSGT
ncbi:hypothetical protein B488_05090 [Liberibacter crescens BT-1]|uniref:Phage major capsid protein n=1 Tax=Liberibacter crescens (strain BT-1) TaxID=1215343 RepID=L0EVV9_LIBCB|nr:DUF5309 domain-containing protein [Liberibacter crescens]AGA64501.1 hypothetical protein B488_05090 [Liberibacter crescens BT-1]AMC12657.1 hypothetical protein RL73_02640 [Liberibacter crescens]